MCPSVGIRWSIVCNMPWRKVIFRLLTSWVTLLAFHGRCSWTMNNNRLPKHGTRSSHLKYKRTFLTCGLQSLKLIGYTNGSLMVARIMTAIYFEIPPSYIHCHTEWDVTSHHSTWRSTFENILKTLDIVLLPLYFQSYTIAKYLRLNYFFVRALDVNAFTIKHNF